MSKQDTIAELITPTIEQLGFEVVGIEYHANTKNAIVRVFVDKEGGITLDDCTLISRQVSGLMDVNDPIAGKYNLEVSSPGLDRPLYTVAHFQRFVGRRVNIRLLAPVNGQRKYKGVIEQVDGEEITFTLEPEKGKKSVEVEQLTVAHHQIDAARLIPDF